MDQIPIRKSDIRRGGVPRFVTQEKLDAFHELQAAVEQRVIAQERLALCDRIVTEAIRKVEETQ